MVGVRRQVLQPLLQITRLQRRVEALLELPLGRGVLGREADQRSGVTLGGGAAGGGVGEGGRGDGQEQGAEESSRHPGAPEEVDGKGDRRFRPVIMVAVWCRFGEGAGRILLPMSGPFADYFSSHADRYARFRPRYPQTLFDHLAAIAPERRLAWDCATGNGQAAAGLARRFARVLASDASLSQLRHATRPPGQLVVAARAEACPSADSAVDLVTVAQAVHWFLGPAFWDEVRRVARPGGVVALWGYHLAELGAALDAPFRRFYHDVVGPYWPAERSLLERGYDTIELPFAELPAPRLTMTERWRRDDFVGYVGTWSAVGRYRQQIGVDPLPAFAAELREVWPDGEVRDVSWPLQLRIARVESGTREARGRAVRPAPAQPG